MLWIAVYLPQLPLEALLRGFDRANAGEALAAWAIVDGPQIFLSNAEARASGVREGMSVSAAHAIAPHLHTRPRDPAAEEASLFGLAGWAKQFTPNVAVEQPHTLLLEVESSLNLFNGLGPILRSLRMDLDAMGFTSLIAAAPTALGAAWLARANLQIAVGRMHALEQRLAALGPRAIGCSEDECDFLSSIGATTLGDILALPRNGLARRVGQALLDRIERALGRRPDPRRFYEPPLEFFAKLELPAEVEQADALLFAARRLLIQLVGFLAAHKAGVQRFALQLVHANAPSSEVMIGLLSPSREAEHFILLLRERLARVELREPVRAIALTAEDIVPLASSNLALFRDNDDAPEDWTKLVERLRARLGADAIHGLELANDHRPEHTWSVADFVPLKKASDMQPKFGPRPLWLLREPRRLHAVDAQPHYRGPLTVLSGPERIESGWWSGDDLRRDYFVARTEDHVMVWVYRERTARTAGHWYLHGLFG